MDTDMPGQFRRVYRNTGRLCPAYRSKAVPKNCLLTVGRAPHDRCAALAGTPLRASVPVAVAAVRTTAAPTRVPREKMVRAGRVNMEPPVATHLHGGCRCRAASHSIVNANISFVSLLLIKDTNFA